MSILNINTDTTLNYDGTNFSANSVTLTAPVTIVNTGSGQITVTLVFATIANINDYLIIGSNNLTFDGLGAQFSTSVNGFGGIFQNSTSNTGIIIQNISIGVVTPGTLASGAGWICSNVSGLTVNNCSSTNAILRGSGGIFGLNCDNCVANNCFSTGDISSGSGGIFGSGCTNCTANVCYSNGTITSGSGGIFGALTNSGATSSNCVANRCFSTGTISSFAGNGGGGIFANGSNYFATSSTCTANGCYSMGAIGVGSLDYNNGGIFGSGSNLGGTSSTCTADGCCSIGNIYGDNEGSNGGIFAGTVGSTSIAINCFSIGSIGEGCGGIILSGDSCTATNCYSTGAIDSYGGGIFGPNCTSCIANTSYSIGSIGFEAGGIYGFGANSCSASSCYSLGTLDTSAGSIFGSEAVSCSCTNCYVLYGTTLTLFGSDGSNNTATNCIAENGGEWNNANALATIALNNSSWFIPGSDNPFLLISYTNNTTLVPYGYQYSYTFPNSTTITSNGSISYTLLTGFLPQSEYPSFPAPFPTNLYGYNFITLTLNIDVPPPACFLQGTKILTDAGYKAIEKLQIGDLVKTVNNGFKKILLIGYKKVFNDKKNKNCIYHYKKEKNPTLTEDLFITGFHSALVKTNSLSSHLTPKIDNYSKLTANMDKRAIKWDYTGEITVWHLALDNKQFGIYANGLLVESASLKALKSLTNK